MGGQATDDVAVAKVDVAVQSTAGQWWRADNTWGDYQTREATLDAPGAPNSRWSFTWTPPETGTYTVTAAAVDASATPTRRPKPPHS